MAAGERKRDRIAAARDMTLREGAINRAEQTMRAADAFANRMRPIARKAIGVEEPVETFHDGLAGSFAIKAEYREVGGGLHLNVYARSMGREGSTIDPHRIGYRIEVTGASLLTEAEAEAVIRLLIEHRTRKGRG